MPGQLASAATLILVASVASAEPTLITIPGQGWHLSIDAPAPVTTSGKVTGARFSYTAHDSFSKITYSIHTETLVNGTNESCRDKVLARGADLPWNIKEDQVTPFETPAVVGKTSRFVVETAGLTETTANAHAFMVVDDKCVSVHVSQSPYSDACLTEVGEIARSIRIVR